jgi:CRISPR/Cas system-associated exonuclease Cas4 (RecB family)
MPDILKSELPRPFTFSQSSLQDYSECPRRFQLRYIEQLAWPAVETEPVLENERRQQEGQLFHRMVQQHLIGLPGDKVSLMANTPELSRWWDNYIHAPDLQSLRETNKLYTELTLVAPIGSQRLLAKYDLVAISPEEKALIVDWKTYKKRPRDEWMAARQQTSVYRVLLIQAGATLNGGVAFEPDQIEMVYWYTNYPFEPASFPYTTTRYKHDWKVLTGLVEEIEGQRLFPLTENEKKCTYCPYRSYCDRGEKAGLMDEAEVDTDITTSVDINFEQIAEIEF